MGRRTRGQELLPALERGPLTVSRPALLTGHSDHHFRHMIHSLVGYANCVLGVRDCFATLLGITGAQYEILMVVYRLRGSKPCSVSEVAVEIHRTIAFVTNETKKLAAQGLVAKRGDPKDGRRINLTVTASCVAALKAIAPVQRALNDALFEDLNSREFQKLCQLYEKLPACGERALQLAESYRAKNTASKTGLRKKNGREAISRAKVAA
jgi:MarR family transcriptional regulator, organic hydroperoxide resistance regulator